MTAPMIDYKIHWLKMMSVPESQAVVGRHDGINGRDSTVRTAFLAMGDSFSTRKKIANSLLLSRVVGLEQGSQFGKTRPEIDHPGNWLEGNRTAPKHRQKEEFEAWIVTGNLSNSVLMSP